MSLLKQFEIPEGFQGEKKIEHFDVYNHDYEHYDV